MMRPGDQIGDYIVERQIGRGGMSLVYRARHALDGSLVAVKVLRPNLVGHPTAWRRFLSEVDAVRDVIHVNVVRRLGGGLLAPRHPYLVLELLDGVSVASLVGPGRTLLTAAGVQIVKQAAAGLDAVHEAGVIHRDVNPSNIVLAHERPDRARVKIIDFGVAKLLDSIVGLSSENVDLGSPSFRAPEQERESSRVDHRADIYSLAVTAFFLLSSGLMPWGVGPLAALLERKALDPTPNLRALFPALSDDQALVLQAGMARDPMKRWASAGRFAAALAAASGVTDGDADQLAILLALAGHLPGDIANTAPTPTPCP